MRSQVEHAECHCPCLSHLPIPTAHSTCLQAGLDSSISAELHGAINTHFDLDLPANTVFDYPTLGSLAAFLSGLLLQKDPAEDDASKETQLLVACKDLQSTHYKALGRNSMSALVAVSSRYPEPKNIDVSATTAGVTVSTPTASTGNTDFAGFQAAMWAGANIPSLVPPQRWDIDASYNPGVMVF